MFIVIGSIAANQRVSSWREAKDFDVLVDSTEEQNFMSLVPEGLRVEPLVISDLKDYSWVDPDGYATAEELYTIKVSHSYWKLKNGSWKKHMFDIVKFQEQGVKLIPELHDFLYPKWENLHGKKK